MSAPTFPVYGWHIICEEYLTESQHCSNERMQSFNTTIVTMPAGIMMIRR